MGILKGTTIAVTLILSASPAFAYMGRNDAIQIGSDLLEGSQARIRQDLTTHAEATGRVEGRSANTLSQECIFAAELVRRGDSRFVPYLKARVDALLAVAIMQSDDAMTWSRRAEEGGAGLCPSGGFDAFSDGTCDPPGTPYAFQSAMALMCLGRAAVVLNDVDLSSRIQPSLKFWASRTTTPSGCKGCTYFWPSGNPNDSNRLVRNTNIYLALTMATGMPDTKAPLLIATSLASEAFEKKSGNHGYYSVLDPIMMRRPLEKERTENHMAGLATALLALYHLTGQSSALELANWNYSVWARCSNQGCQTRPCSYWAADPNRCRASYTFAHCAFRKHDPNARAICDSLVSSGSRLGNTSLMFIMTGD